MADKNDVVSLVTLSGEFVGKFVSETTNEVVLADPHLVTPNGDQIGFMPVVCMTGETNLPEVTFFKTSTLCMVPTAEPVQKEYRRSTSGLIL